MSRCRRVGDVVGGASTGDFGAAADDDCRVDAALHDAHDPGEVDVIDIVGGSCVNEDAHTLAEDDVGQEHGAPTTHT